jgi:hypothetical protein
MPIITPAYKKDAPKNTAILLKKLLKLLNPKASNIIRAEITILNIVSVIIPVGGRNMYSENAAPTNEAAIILKKRQFSLHSLQVSFKIKKLTNRLSTISTSAYTTNPPPPKYYLNTIIIPAPRKKC